MNSKLKIGSFVRFASAQSYKAMPSTASIVINGLAQQSHYRSTAYTIREEIDRIAFDLLSAGKAVRTLLLLNGEDGLPLLEIKYPVRTYAEAQRASAFKKVITIRCTDFGIKKKHLKKLIKNLDRFRMPPLNSDYSRLSNMGDAIMDRAGTAVSWLYSPTSKFTDPCILLSSCAEKEFAIKLCKRIENEVNAFLREVNVEASITVPCYSLSALNSARDSFISGDMKIEDFSNIVFGK